jgi:hypothetical protein
MREFQDAKLRDRKKIGVLSRYSIFKLKAKSEKLKRGGGVIQAKSEKLKWGAEGRD